MITMWFEQDSKWMSIEVHVSNYMIELLYAFIDVDCAIMRKEA